MLLGEYAVLDGGLSLVAAAGRYAQCAFRGEGVEPKIPEIAAPGLTDEIARPGQPCAPDHPLAFVQGLLDRWPDPTAGRYTTDSRDLYSQESSGEGAIKLGLGSSAAVSVALAGALTGAGGGALRDGRDPAEWPTRRAIFERVQRAHRAVQGSGSGADIGAAVAGGVIAYRRWPDQRASEASGGRWRAEIDGTEITVDEAPWPGEAPILMAWTGQAASTKRLVAQVKAWAARDPEGWAARCRDISAAAEAVMTRVHSSDPRSPDSRNPDLRAAVQAGAEAIAALGRDSGAPLIIPAHTTIAQIAREHGGVAKPTGAAGGDLSWVIPPADPEAADAMSRALIAAGHPTVSLPICWRGLHLVEGSADPQ